MQIQSIYKEDLMPKYTEMLRFQMLIGYSLAKRLKWEEFNNKVK